VWMQSYDHASYILDLSSQSKIGKSVYLDLGNETPCIYYRLESAQGNLCTLGLYNI
jgi:hypothetical protein